MKIRLLSVLPICCLSIVFTAKADGLPANPWAKKAQLTTQYEQPIIINSENTAEIDYSVSIPVQNIRRRNAGGVGKISAPVQTRQTTSTSTDDTKLNSAFSDLFTDNEAKPQTPETNSTAMEIPQMDINFSAEYEKMKRQGLNKWNGATAPIRGYYQKWRKALQEVGEMDLKDFMP